jgi:hypothetical protein
VLYHEFLHYGGNQGHPKYGIENETEVLLREVLFARHLLARLAPAADADLPAYEASLAAAIESTELLGLGQQLFVDFEEEDSFAKVNEQIVATYGDGLAQAEAAAAVQEKIDFWNREIERHNRTDPQKLAWCPWIEWPRLEDPAMYPLRSRLATVLQHALEQGHRLDPERRDALWAEPPCDRHREAWQAYRRREGALERLAGHFGGASLDETVLQAIVQRFVLQPDGPTMGNLLDLLRALGLDFSGPTPGPTDFSI